MVLLKVKVLVLVIFFALPIYSQSIRDTVNGWFYGGAWGTTDTINTYTQIEDGGFGPSDSVQRFNSFGWTIKNGSNEWGQQNSFGKFHLPNGPYPLPKKIFIDVNIIMLENVQQFGMAFSIADTANGGYMISNYLMVDIVYGWQTIEFNVWGTYPPELVVSMLAMDFISFTTNNDSGYTGVEVQVNNAIFWYENGDTILVDPFQYDWITGVEPVSELTPNGFVLEQNYPNPFNPNTKIRYKISELSSVKLTVYNLLGEKVIDLVNSEQGEGSYEVEFNASKLPSGIYFYRLQADSFIETKRMLLLK